MPAAITTSKSGDNAHEQQLHIKFVIYMSMFASRYVLSSWTPSCHSWELSTRVYDNYHTYAPHRNHVCNTPPIDHGVLDDNTECPS